MKKALFSCLLVAIISLCFFGKSVAATYDATAEFSITNGNPNNVWTYGWMDTSFTTFNFLLPGMDNGSPYWRRVAAYFSYPLIWRNDSVQVKQGVIPGQMGMHPGSSGEASVLRWTAPTDGIYHIDGQFFSGMKGVMLLGVRKGNSWLWQGTDSGAFNLTETVAANESIDFVVYGSYSYGMTPFELTITGSPVPVPAAAYLFVTGLFALIGFSRRC